MSLLTKTYEKRPDNKNGNLNALNLGCARAALYRGEFRDAIKNYQAKDETDDCAIIEDPNWHIVVEKARDIIKEWDKYNLGSNDRAFKLN